MPIDSSKMTDDRFRGCYGSQCSPVTVSKWVKKNIIQNIEREDNGSPKIALNIWGLPGMGKTSVVKQLKNDKLPFRKKDAEGNLLPAEEMNIRIVDIPLAQIEEMGDVLGYPVEEIQLQKNGTPVWVKAVDSIIKNKLDEGYFLTGAKRTTYAPPSWVPTEECPGVILFDDGNRASQRIMKGLMQLVQDHRTISWSLPRGWTIVFTGNPDNRYNQVTSMDGAQLTRMKHVTLKFDYRQWAEWAIAEGLDQRGIDWVLAKPEEVTCKERTNPRTIAEFLRTMKNYKNLLDSEAIKELTIEANSCLDEDTWTSMMTFFNSSQEKMIAPTLILDDPDTAVRNMMDLKNNGRLDIISVANDRLVLYIKSDEYKYDDKHKQAFLKWMKAMHEVADDLMCAAVAFLNEDRDKLQAVPMEFLFQPSTPGAKSVRIKRTKADYIFNLVNDNVFCNAIKELKSPTDLEQFK